MENLLYFLIPLLTGWFLDKIFGDPSRLPHPILLFGKTIAKCEHVLNHGKWRMFKGAVMSLTFIMVVYFFTFVLLFITQREIWISIIIASIFVFYCLAGKTLIQEVREVFRACDRSLEEGCRQVARIVGRDTSNLSAQEVRTAALETLSENMSDGVIAPLFWYMLLGVPGMLAYKMINSLDSMIGYRNECYILFGRVAARIDDVANFIPARLTAALMILVSGKWSLFSFVIRFGNKHLSPNSGYPEAALAGILNCRFGGPHDYFGKTVDKPYIGTNERTLSSKDMEHAIKIARLTEYLAIIICVAILFLAY